VTHHFDIYILLHVHFFEPLMYCNCADLSDRRPRGSSSRVRIIYYVLMLTCLNIVNTPVTIIKSFYLYVYPHLHSGPKQLT